MRTEHPGIEGGLFGFCPAFLNRGRKGQGHVKRVEQPTGQGNTGTEDGVLRYLHEEDVRIETGGGASWSKPGVTQQAQVDMESYYFSAKTEPRLRKLRDENAPPLSVDLTDMDGLAQVETEMGEERSDGDEDAAGVDERE